MSMFRSSILRSTRATAPRFLGPSTPLRNYANKKDMSAVQGDQTTQASSNVTNPISASSEAQGVNKSRGLESESEGAKGMQSPIDNPKGAGSDGQEGNTSTQDAHKQDPNKSDAEKRKVVEEQGQKPLDAANK